MEELVVWLSILLLVLPFVQGTSVNVTVDDTDSSLSYYPSDAWNTQTCGSTCTAKPEEALAYDGTWHECTFNSQPGSNNYPNQVLSASAIFTGTGVYVYGIIADSSSAPTGNSDMTFIMDGVVSGTYVQDAPGFAGYQYNVLLFSSTTLKSGAHNLTIENGKVDAIKSLLMLDYLIYTHDEAVTTTTTTTTTSSSTQSVVQSSSISTSSTLSSTSGPTTPLSSTSAVSSQITSFSDATSSMATQLSSISSSANSNNDTSSTSNNATTSSSHVNTGAIAGSVVGACVILVIIAFLIYRRRVKNQEQDTVYGEVIGYNEPMRQAPSHSHLEPFDPYNASNLTSQGGSATSEIASQMSYPTTPALRPTRSSYATHGYSTSNLGSQSGSAPSEITSQSSYPSAGRHYPAVTSAPADDHRSMTSSDNQRESRAPPAYEENSDSSNAVYIDGKGRRRERRTPPSFF